MSTTTAAGIRGGLGHPVVDGDGHWVEYHPVITEAMRRVGGDVAAQGFASFGKMIGSNVALSTAERRARNMGHEAWWAVPTANTLDRATAMMPALLNERLDELGIDFTVLYPTQGLGVVNERDGDVRRAACRAYNTVIAEYFGPYSRRMTPAAVIPMFTPDEAMDALDHAVGELGLKVAMFGSMVPRLVDDPDDPRASGPIWLDVLGLDSAYDYDPVWQRCEELGISPSFHANGRGQGFGLRASPSNFSYNHIGHFAAADEAVCKALFFGGVTRRFPKLRFAFLEGGVAWACQLLHDITEHWELRRSEGLYRTNPRNLDYERLDELARRYGTEAMQAAIARRRNRPTSPAEGLVGGREAPDDFAACGIEQAEDITELFVKPFWFGCEAEDRLAAWAFKAENNAFGARLNAVFGSDIGHFDVTDMARVLPDAYELVEDGLMSAEDFRDFSFGNAVRFLGGGNPSFFAGTVVEAEAKAVLAADLLARG
jgi:predicted TIM-barrel fold metal-dependent hydrolase